MDQIITSLLENDLYKFSMGQAIYHHFSDYKTTWTFKCRNKDVVFSDDVVEEIKHQIRMYCALRFDEEELEYLHNIRWIKGSYVDFLRLWQPRYEDFHFGRDEEGNFTLETTGTWLNTSLYEVPTLAIINEVYFRMNHDYKQLLEDYKKRALEKCLKLQSGEYELNSFSEFGLRRRLSGEAQDHIVKLLQETQNPASRYVGTSNVYLAKKYGLTPVGTMAHEWIMCVGQGDHKNNPAYSNYFALEAWVDEYGVLNGTALTDTITTDLFLMDFNRSMVNNYTGVRHDSGDPYEWGEKIITHYKHFGVDPATKLLLFSDSLDFDRAQRLYDYFHDKTKVSFGIGTFVSNDTCEKALNIVIKLQYVNGRPVAKLSDTPGKAMCRDESYLEYLKRSVDFRLDREKKR